MKPEKDKPEKDKSNYPTAWGTGFSLKPEREHLDAQEATAFFVAVAKRIYGERFDYSRVVLPGNSIKIALSRPVTIGEPDKRGRIDWFRVIPLTHLLTQDGR